MRRYPSSRRRWRRGWRSQALCVKTNLHKAIHKQTETQTKKSDTKTILNTIKNTNTNLKYKHKPKPQTLHDLINQYHHTFIIFISNMFSSDPYRMNATHLDFFVFRRLSWPQWPLVRVRSSLDLEKRSLCGWFDSFALPPHACVAHFFPKRDASHQENGIRCFELPKQIAR